MENQTHNVDPRGRAQRRRRLSYPIGLTMLGAMASVLALIAIDVFAINGAQSAPVRSVVHVVKVSGAAKVKRTVYLSVAPGVKPAVGGKLHDAFSVTHFAVHPGQPVKLVINNTDTSDHSITASSAGVNIVVRPGLHTYTLLVHKRGRFEWRCTYPCDPYSMQHVGYMRGYITSV